MKRQGGLAREIATRMALVTLAGLTVAAGCAFLVYLWVFENHPGAVPAPHLWAPEPVDYLAIALSVGVAVGLSIWAGRSLARRIVLPLSSLASAARRIAGGDLAARASVDDRSPRETVSLVEDFNSMAVRLEGVADGIVAWNAAIAHELRTPVTILKGRLQGVWDGVFEMDDATQTSLLRQIDQLARLVEDLRIVSLADSGRLQLQIELVDLAEVIGDLRGAVEPGLRAAGFVASWTLEAGATACDPTRIRQAVLALIENARTHATPGALKISLYRGDETVVISVEDSGPGLNRDPAVAFDPFQRASPSQKGSGLGLAVVRAIVDAHGGRLIYRRGEMGGSLFEIEMPVRTLGEAAAPERDDVFGRYLQR